MEKSLVDGGGGHGETGVSTKVDTVSSSKQTISDLPVDSSTVSSPAGTGLSPGSFSPSSSSFLQEKETREKDSERRFHAVPRLRQTETAAEGWGDRETDEDSLLFVSPSPLQTHRSSPSRTTSIPETVSGGDFGAERTTTGGGGGGEEEVVDRHRRFHLQQPRHTSGRSRGGEEREGKSNKNTHDRRTSHGNSTMKNYYQVLGVRTDAPPDEIRRVYYALCKIYHPDKSSCSARGGTAVGGEEEENRLSPSHTSQYFHAERLCAIQQAYAVLSDEVKRLHYDLRIGIFKGQDKWRKLTEVYQIQRKRAARDLENMRSEYTRKVHHERQINGLIIKRAWYGNLRLKRRLLDQEYLGRVTADCVEGPFLDVTVPLQCHVDNSRFIFPGGSGSSMELLNGFFNPAPCVQEHDICLYVHYFFRGGDHEVTVSDRSYLAIPLKCHRVDSSIGLRGPYAPSNVSAGCSRTTSCNSSSRGGGRTRSSGKKGASLTSFTLPTSRLTSLISTQRSREEEEEQARGSLRVEEERRLVRKKRPLKLSEVIAREKSLREEQRLRDQNLRSLLLWGTVLTWSGFCLYASAYNKEGARRVLVKILGDRAAGSCMCLFPPTLSPASQHAWLRILRFEFLLEKWPLNSLVAGLGLFHSVRSTPPAVHNYSKSPGV